MRPNCRRVLKLLSDGQERSVRDVALGVFLSPDHTQKLLRDLLDDGLVVRRHDPKPGRGAMPYLYSVSALYRERADLEALELERRGFVPSGELARG